jgi:hypothetical protein
MQFLILLAVRNATAKVKRAVATHRRTICTATERKNNESILKVAIVGGGPAGLCTALQLAPLVSKGYIQAPIDVYEAKQSYASEHEKNDTIGVGIWSTALLPFLRINGDSTASINGQQQQQQRPSYKMVFKILESVGCFVKNVGYRTSNGSWITHTTLSTNLDDNQQPSLLFLQRHTLMKALYDAISIMEQQAIQIHYGHNVKLIKEQGKDGEAALLCVREEQQKKEETFTKSYNLIVVAEGMNSNLRKQYSMHLGATNKSPSKKIDVKEDTSASSMFLTTMDDDVEDRGYTVFRGNGILDSGMSDAANSMDSFQTWGDKNSMRFAVVPCLIQPTINNTTENNISLGWNEPSVSTQAAAPQQTETPQLVQGYTWFFTTDDPSYYYDDNYSAPTTRKARILESLCKWHDPIYKLIQSTRAEDIVMERALAHRNSASALGSGFERKEA